MKEIDEWLLSAESVELDMPAFVEQLADRLLVAGFDLLRMSAWVSTQHPEVWGSQLVWARETGCKVIPRPHDTWESPAFQGSPGQAVLRRGEAIRVRLTGTRSELEFPMLAEVADLGGTDYLIVACGGESWVAYTSGRKDGFTGDEITYLISLARLQRLHFRLAASHYATRSLLEVYLGANAAERVMSGAFRRGTGTTLRAAIWFCDMRGFTGLSDRLPPREVVSILDEYFECVAGPIEDQGGEILKLIGDAALAIFPVGDADPADACRRALAAARETLDGLAAWRAVPGRPDLRLGVALHVGEVFYGNIGGRRRLDFTVIGAAVNEVCRVESLCKELGSPLLMTSAFAKGLGREDLVSRGRHALKGVAEPQEIFTLPS